MEDNNSRIMDMSKFNTKEHWKEIKYDDQNVWQCLHCQKKQYSINTSNYKIMKNPFIYLSKF